MSTFTAVELSKLPVPDLTEQVSFEQSYADLKATLYLLAPEYATLLESDPMSVLLQVCAYREVHLRESFNVRGKGNMLAYAGGADLDNLGAFFGVVRQQITPADPKTNTPAVMESDVELRRRIQLGTLTFDTASRSVFVAEQPVALARREVDVLEVVFSCALNADKIVGIAGFRHRFIQKAFEK